MYCVYNERLITCYNVHHHRQFKESINGDRYPMFPGGQADIVIDDAGNYRVLTTQKEVLFIGTGKAAVSTYTATTDDARGNIITTGNDPKLAGFNEALARVRYAQPNADIAVYHNGRKYTAEDYADKLDTANQDPPSTPFP